MNSKSFLWNRSWPIRIFFLSFKGKYQKRESSRVRSKNLISFIKQTLKLSRFDIIYDYYECINKWKYFSTNWNVSICHALTIGNQIDSSNVWDKWRSAQDRSFISIVTIYRFSVQWTVWFDIPQRFFFFIFIHSLSFLFFHFLSIDMWTNGSSEHEEATKTRRWDLWTR